MAEMPKEDIAEANGHQNAKGKFDSEASASVPESRHEPSLVPKLPRPAEESNAPANRFLTALRALPASAHGPRVDVVYDKLVACQRVPVEQSGMSNVAKSVVDFATLASFRKNTTTDLQILAGQSGAFRAGTSSLIIGSSGSGKTTFLRLLAGREIPTSGKVLWNGLDPKASGAHVSKLATMAPQLDIHEPLLTVTETFRFAAECCLAPLPANTTEVERNMRSSYVDDVIDMLGLRECQAVIVGNEQARGISGGQKKRVTLGEALLTGSRVLCLDEVTNGLDAATAAEIMGSISAWAKVPSPLRSVTLRCLTRPAICGVPISLVNLQQLQSCRRSVTAFLLRRSQAARSSRRFKRQRPRS